MHRNIVLWTLFSLSFIQCQTKKMESVNSFTSISQSTIKLPISLNEISGISYSSEGKLFGHNDEIGVVYQINQTNGKIIKRFQLGSWGIEADFEGIAVAHDRFFLITSKGILYEFREGSDLEKVKFNEIDLGFSSSFEIEGLCYDQATNSLLIASKNYAGKDKKHKGMRAVYSFALETNKLDKTPRFLLSLKELKSKYEFKGFYPSAISRNPSTGNFFILSSKGGSSIIEMDSKGNLLNGWKLDNKTHPQPEGLTFDQNGNMLISDESVGRSARITIYKLHKE